MNLIVSQYENLYIAFSGTYALPNWLCYHNMQVLDIGHSASALPAFMTEYSRAGVHNLLHLMIHTTKYPFVCGPY
jgi:hypothetical protein